MKKNYRYAKYLLLAFSFVLVGESFCQGDTSLNFEFDTTLELASFNFTESIVHDYLISHYPSRKDSIICEKYSRLINAEPTKENHSDFYTLARSLWQLGRLREAENMFLKIMSCSEPYYVKTFYHFSDIAGDTTLATYGYGSYTSNYKNSACRYLAQIYIEENRFEQALKYIEYADKHYVVEQNCGTGYMWYRNEIEGLYGLAYEGLEMCDSIINLFLPQYSNHSAGLLIRSLKKVYSEDEINEGLKVAENSIVCVVDTFETSSFIISHYGEEDETRSEIKYISGNATMNLFGRQVNVPVRELMNGQKVTRELFVEEFKKSAFYVNLIDSG